MLTQIGHCICLLEIWPRKIQWLRRKRLRTCRHLKKHFLEFDSLKTVIFPENSKFIFFTIWIIFLNYYFKLESKNKLRFTCIQATLFTKINTYSKEREILGGQQLFCGKHLTKANGFLVEKLRLAPKPQFGKVMARQVTLGLPQSNGKGLLEHSKSTALISFSHLFVN